MKRSFMAFLLSIPPTGVAAVLAGSTGAAAQAGSTGERAECDRLISMIEDRTPAGAYDALQQMRVFRDGAKYKACIEAAQASGAGNAARGTIQVGRLAEMEVFNAQGIEIGDVDRLVSSEDGRTYVLVTFRGPRWPGDKQVALPIENMVLDGNVLRISGIVEDELQGMPSVHQDGRSYIQLPESGIANLRIAPPSETGSAAPKQ